MTAHALFVKVARLRMTSSKYNGCGNCSKNRMQSVNFLRMCIYTVEKTHVISFHILLAGERITIASFASFTSSKWIFFVLPGVLVSLVVSARS